MNAFLLASLLATAVVPSPAAPGPLAPTGKWMVEYNTDMCVLSHQYGEGSGKVTLGLRPWPMGDDTEIVLLQPGPSVSGLLTGKARVMLGPENTPIDGTYNAFFAQKTKARVTTINVKQSSLARLDAATTITVILDGKARVSVAPSNMKAALGALATCDDDLLRSWHLDPAEQMLIATPPVPVTPNAQWISEDDYPSDAIRRNSGGTVTILWTIGTDGKITNCNVAQSSGDPLLDQAACMAISKRGRYKPALDKDGRPIASHSTRRIVWRLPG